MDLPGHYIRVAETQAFSLALALHEFPSENLLLTMDNFLLENAARHQLLVARFKPSYVAQTVNNGGTNSNIVVATRIRPMLEEEVASGQVVAAFPRDDSNGVVDIHQLRRVVRGPPPLSVSVALLKNEKAHPNSHLQSKAYTLNAY